MYVPGVTQPAGSRVQKPVYPIPSVHTVPSAHAGPDEGLVSRRSRDLCHLCTVVRVVFSVSCLTQPLSEMLKYLPIPNPVRFLPLLALRSI